MAANKTIGEYIAQFPDDIQGLLESVRKVIRKAIPESTETVSYGMPAFRYRNKVLVYFAAYKKHIGFYPTPSGIEAFSEELGGYTSSKGAVQFPLDKPLPLDLIRRIAIYRKEEVSVE